MTEATLSRCARVAALMLCVACGDSPKTVTGTGSGAANDDAGTGTTRDAGRLADGAVRDAGPRSNAGCVNLQCKQRTCANGGTTSVSGTVYDPAGKNPLYNVAVFVPNSKPEPFKFGATCDRCDDLYTGSPVTAALTDAAGTFKLNDVPVGNDIPLVIQIGKWRRQLTLDTVSECEDNPQPDRSLRLPKNRGEGDIPKIAVSTGGADTLECLLRRVGVDADEYEAGGAGEGRIHIYQGNHGADDPVATNTSPAGPSSQAALWSSTDQLMDYDVVLLSCEGDETQSMNQQALHDYASAGGRVFASHFHYSWFNSGPYGNENLATWSAGSNEIGNVSGSIVTTLANGKPFAKGQALASWLANVGALRNGKLPIEDGKHNADVTAANTPSQSWIVAEPGLLTPGATQYFSFNTPTDALDNASDTASPTYCGRVVFSDLHVGAASRDNRGRPVPDGCANAALSPQEAALEFMLFDLSSCIVPDEIPPTPPPVVPVI